MYWWLEYVAWLLLLNLYLAIGLQFTIKILSSILHFHIDEYESLTRQSGKTFQDNPCLSLGGFPFPSDWKIYLIKLAMHKTCNEKITRHGFKISALCNDAINHAHAILYVYNEQTCDYHVDAVFKTIK